MDRTEIRKNAGKTSKLGSNKFAVTRYFVKSTSNGLTCRTQRSPGFCSGFQCRQPKRQYLIFHLFASNISLTTALKTNMMHVRTQTDRAVTPYASESFILFAQFCSSSSIRQLNYKLTP